MVGGDSHQLAVKLLESHQIGSSSLFKAGQLFSTSGQQEFYTKTFDTGPLVSHCLTAGYEIPFSKVPTKYLSARNNKSCRDNLYFNREEI